MISPDIELNCHSEWILVTGGTVLIIYVYLPTFVSGDPKVSLDAGYLEDGLPLRIERSGQQTYQDDWKMSGKMTMYSPGDTPPNNQFLRIAKSGQDNEELPPGAFYLRF